MNYFKAAEQILSSLPDLERAVKNLQQRENRIVSSGAPKTPAAIDYTKPFTDAKSVNDALTEMLELTEVRRHIKKTESYIREIKAILAQMENEQSRIARLWYIERLPKEEIMRRMCVESLTTIYMMMNTNGYQEAAWGQLCAEIVEELTSGFKEVDTSLLKLSAFMPVCKAMLELGPEWLDSFVRQVLYEAYANGLEAGAVSGDGNGKPIGMNRQVGDNVTVTGGVYPEKSAIAVSDLSPATIGNLLALLATDPNGKARTVRDVILVVNPVDYFQRIMPATTLMGPDGSYRNDVLPYPMTVIQSPAVDQGKAIIGLGYKYFAAVGAARDGRIDYSDHYHFIEDERVYLIKGYANGFPMDNNAFFVLDISNVQPAVWKVQQVTAPTASAVADLADLRIGGLALSPAFTSATTTGYTASTTNTTNTVTAIPADANATIEITNEDAEETETTIINGRAVTWGAGANTLTIKVTAENGTATKSYVVTVTKS